MNDYPDLSSPKKEETSTNYPDLSQPVTSVAKPSENVDIFRMKQSTPQQRKQFRNMMSEAAQGALQSYINTPEQAANIFGKHLYKPFNFAPNTENARQGGIAGDIASFFQPEVAISALGKLPLARNVFNAAKTSLQSKPIMNFLSKILKTGGQAALFEKEKFPQATKTDTGKAAAIGSSLETVAQLVGSRNPLVSALGKTLLGSTLGYHYGGYKGIPAGIAGMFTVPKMAQEAGLINKPLASEILTQEPAELPLQRYLAGKRIDSVPTPAEAFNNPIMGSRQGMIGRTEQGAEEMTRLGTEKIEMQQNAINNLLDKIYPYPNKKNRINKLYRASDNDSISMNALDQFGNDPVFEQAINMVNNDPVYKKNLGDFRVNSIPYLNQVKKALNELEENAMGKFGNATNKSATYRQTANELTDIMDKASPAYKFARAESQKQIIRRNIEDRIGKRALTGKNFYTEFLANPNKVKELLSDLKTNPEAQQMVRDMQLSWENLIGMDTAAGAAGATQRHTNTAREEFQKFWNEYKTAIGAPKDVERARFIHDPEWWKKFDEVIKYNSKIERGRKLAELVSKGMTAGILTYSKETLPSKEKKS